MRFKDLFKGILILLTIVSFINNMEVLAWVCLLCWGMKGFWAILMIMDKGGAFDD